MRLSGLPFCAVLRGLLVLAFIGSCLLPAAGRAADAVIPPFSAWVVDTSGTLDEATVQDLNARLEALDAETGAQLAVLMVPSLGGESVESYATRVFAQWQLGRRQIDDGVLLLIATQDRLLRIEVGYGLEAAIPDVLAGRIIREQITPALREGDFSRGVQAGVDSLIALIHGEELPAPAQEGGEGEIWQLLVILAVLAISMLRYRFRGAPASGRGSWRGPGGGGRGGGFRGGGGGRSGGGGASGRW